MKNFILISVSAFCFSVTAQAGLSCNVVVDGKALTVQGVTGDDGCTQVDLEARDGWEQGSWALTCDNKNIQVQFQIGNPADMNVEQNQGSETVSLSVVDGGVQKSASCKITK